jgi:hypothetical protein
VFLCTILLFENLDFKSCPTILLFIDRDKDGICIGNTLREDLKDAVPLGEVEVDDMTVLAAHQFLCTKVYLENFIPKFKEIINEVEAEILLNSLDVNQEDQE